jgi:hypothetical protein
MLESVPTFVKILRYEKSDSKQKYILNKLKASKYFTDFHDTIEIMINKVRLLQKNLPNVNSSFQSDEIEGKFSMLTQKVNFN